MLSARTKQVFAYGRRGHRIVNVVERNESDAFDSPVKTVRNPEAPRQVQRENAIYLSPSPRHRVHGKSKRAHVSPTKAPLGPPRKKAQVKPKKKTALSKFEAQTPVRQPLTPLRTNGVSPTALPPSALARKKGKASVKSSPRAALKPSSPIVTLDIIVLDDDGNKLSQERRVARTDVQINHVTVASSKVGGEGALKTPAIIAISDSDSDAEEVTVVAKKRLGRMRSVIVISSEDDEPPPKCEIEPTAAFFKRQSSFLEVAVPPAPYKLPSPHKPPTVLQQPTPPLPLPPPLPQQQPPVFVPLAPPTTKVRQLTPIRRGQSRALFQRFFPTPSTPTDADLSLELEQLNISDVTEFDLLSPQPDYLIPLLSECSQTCPHEFSAFIETFPFDPIVQPAEGDDLDVKFRKIGEASFSEVFGIGDVVLKIIPLRDEEQRITNDLETPAPSDASDVLKEVIVTRAMGEMSSGFIKLLRTYVVRGRYPSLLLDLWDEYNERKGSESIRPGRRHMDMDNHNRYNC
jgi:serine/threonine-protein kinase haspin